MEALERLKDTDPEKRRIAVEYLGRNGDMSVVKPLARALADTDESVRKEAEKSMWLLWLRSGDQETDRILYLGMELMADGRLHDSINAFTRVIERAPEFAEGYNKRATALYLAGRFEESLEDCDVTLRLNPHHFGALFGKGLNYIGLNDLSSALDTFRDTLNVVPYSQSARQYIQAIEERLKTKGTEL